MMTLEEIKDYNNRPISDEELDELIKSDFVDDYENIGQAPYFPELTAYILYLTDRSEIYVFV